MSEAEDTEKFLRIIKKHYPDISSTNIKSFDGNDHWVFVVGHKVFRFPKIPREFDARQTNFLKKFAPFSPISIPTMEFLKDIETGINYEINTFIPGVSFYPNVAKTFTKKELMDIAAKLGKFLNAVHSFSLEEAREMELDEVDPKNFWQYMEQNSNAFPEYKKVVYPHVSKIERTWIEKLFTEYIALIKKNLFPIRVTHSDMWTYHIIVDPDKHALAGVIDFWGRINDPARDFKAFEYYGNDFVKEVHKHYSLPVDENFEKRRLFYSGHDEVFEFARQLKGRNKDKIAQQKESLYHYITEHPVA